MGNYAVEVIDVTIEFDGVKALNHCTLTVKNGECLGIIGPNGAGKTTLLNVINGFYRPLSGVVKIFGKRVDGLPPHKICQMGVGRVFQVTNVFTNMTVLENILVQSGWKKEGKRAEVKAEQIMEMVKLPSYLKHELAGNISGGQQKLVDIARMLFSEPSILLLDEPVAGIHPTIKEIIIQILTTLKSEKKTIIIVSHDIPSIMRVVDRLAFMSAGRVVMVGNPHEVRQSSKVIEAYLGV
jgi:ABC-type branched-subunit amino acid transport system ATPase component